MIKFFRKIRQKLVFENRFSKYLLYAVGEIFLVVIGILIALQINSWNEYSKNRQLEKDYYLQFKSELEQNIKSAEDQIQYSTYQINNSKIVAYVLEKNSLYKDSQELYLAIEHLGKTYPTQYTNNVWTELLSNGKTLIIRNSEFRKKLAFLDSDMLQTIGLQHQFIENNLGYQRLTGEIFSISLTNDLDSKMHPRELRDSSQMLNLPDQQLIIDKLKAINGLSGYVADIYQTKKINKYLFEKHKDLMLELIDICTSELGE